MAQPAVQFYQERLLVVGHVGSGTSGEPILPVSRGQSMGTLHILAIDVLEVALDAGQVVQDVLEIGSVTNSTPLV